MCKLFDAISSICGPCRPDDWLLTSLGRAQPVSPDVAQERKAGLLRGFEDGRRSAALCRRKIADPNYWSCWFDVVYGCRNCEIPTPVKLGGDYQAFYDAATLLPPTGASLIGILMSVRGDVKKFHHGDVKNYCEFWQLNCSLLEAALSDNAKILADMDATEQKKQDEQRVRGALGVGPAAAQTMPPLKSPEAMCPAREGVGAAGLHLCRDKAAQAARWLTQHWNELSPEERVRCASTSGHPAGPTVLALCVTNSEELNGAASANTDCRSLSAAMGADMCSNLRQPK
jgi:hypothetical protein